MKVLIVLHVIFILGGVGHRARWVAGYQAFTNFFISAGEFKRKVSELRARILAKTKSNGFCLNWEGAKQKKRGVTYGFVKVSFLDKPVTMTAHRAMFLCDHDELKFKTGAGYHISHLCHNPLCVKVEHLTIERGRVNQSRKRCNAKKVCAGHGNRPKCIFPGKLYVEVERKYHYIELTFESFLTAMATSWMSWWLVGS